MTAAQTTNGTALRTIEVGSRVGVPICIAPARARRPPRTANLAESITKMSQADTAYRAALAAIGTTGKTTLMDYL